ncbi:hypothetical protein [Pseudactinotalea sp.]|uniref:hypothetical protein n=1 Tax=Pseudactinotalea sp. TaxID=1926260 RepID=UPI003B3A6A55
MPRPQVIAPQFLTGPFCTAEFKESGYSHKLLLGRRFRRVHPRVWVATDHEMTYADEVLAAHLCMPSGARVTGSTRLRCLGLSFGAASPLHFVIDSDHHSAVEGIVLHRTAEMPPTDDVGVTPAAAFIAYCTSARLIDAIAVGDWLLHRHHITIEELTALVHAQPWRDGAREVRYLLDRLTPRSRSIPESTLRLLLLASGIVGLEVNAEVMTLDGRSLEIDLLARRWNLAIEYDGAHHQERRDQYLTDIERHAALRAMHLEYTVVTKEHMTDSRSMVHRVHRVLLSRGYDGPPPHFGSRWRMLFRPVRELVRDRRGSTKSRQR